MFTPRDDSAVAAEERKLEIECLYSLRYGTHILELVVVVECFEPWTSSSLLTEFVTSSEFPFWVEADLPTPQEHVS